MHNACIRCQDNGFYMGSGFMKTECELCNGNQEQKEMAPSLDSINRKSKSYLNAIKDLMALHPDMTRKEAVKMFDEAYLKA